MFRANLQRTGVYETTALDTLQGIKFKWKSPKGFRHFSIPLVAEDWVYFGVMDELYDGFVYGLNAQTGDVRWKLDFAGVSLQVDAGILYCGGTKSFGLHAIDRETGQLRKTWRRPFGAARLAVSNGILYCGSLVGLTAISSSTELEQWHCGVGGTMPTEPAFSGNRLYFGSYGGRFYCVNPKNGRKLWTFRASERLSMPPAILDDHAYFGCEHGNFHALNIRTRKQSNPIIADGIIYFGDGDFDKMGGRVYAVDARTGREMWRIELPDQVWVEPTIENGVLYFSCRDGNLYALQ